MLLVGGNNISAHLGGPESINAKVVDNKNGTYDASYVPKVVGNYTLDVKLDSSHIKDSPFKVEVVPAAPNASTTEASGDGISHANTDTPAKFKIQTKDAFGNKCAAGGAPISVDIHGPNNENVKANMKDNKGKNFKLFCCCCF